MLKDAALLQLRLLTAALAEGLTLKDATPYNVQWRGARPVFVDVGSFERARDGEPWAGYRQFCMLFLYPLHARGLPRRPVPAVASREHRRDLADRLSRPVHAARRVPARDAATRLPPCEPRARYAGRGGEVRDDLQEAGFDRRLVEANVAGDDEARDAAAARAAERARGPTTARHAATTTRRRAQKEDFVRRVVESTRRGARLGPRLQRRALLADRLERCRPRRGDRLGSARRRRALRAR